MSNCSIQPQNGSAPNKIGTPENLLAELVTTFEDADPPVQILVQPIQLLLYPEFHEFRDSSLCAATLFVGIAWGDQQFDQYVDYLFDNAMFIEGYTLVQPNRTIRLEWRSDKFAAKRYSMDICPSPNPDTPWNSFPYHLQTKSGTKVVLFSLDFFYPCNAVNEGDGVINITKNGWRLFQDVGNDFGADGWRITNKPWHVKVMLDE